MRVNNLDIYLCHSIEIELNISNARIDFSTYFAEWKIMGEDSHIIFGKDAFNTGSKYLRHVHLYPNSPVAIGIWESKWRNNASRTSDKYLFYAESESYGYLLIYIQNDPGGHELFSKPNQEQKKLLKQFEEIAEHFYYTGKIKIPF